MNRFESDRHSFIIRVWTEEGDAPSGRTVCRGTITHVPGNQRRYFQDLDTILLFMAPYLDPMGLRPSLCWRVKQWLMRRTSVRSGDRDE